jgi:hypothetical protein
MVPLLVGSNGGKLRSEPRASEVFGGWGDLNSDQAGAATTSKQQSKAENKRTIEIAAIEHCMSPGSSKWAESPDAARTKRPGKPVRNFYYLGLFPYQSSTHSPFVQW